MSISDRELGGNIIHNMNIDWFMACIVNII